MQTLDFDEARTRFENVASTHQNTYNWIFGSEVDFKDWLRGDNLDPIYFIRGKPGSGKSTLMKFIMTSSCTHALLQKYSDSPWIFAGHFFHDRGAKIQKSIEGFLRRIVHEILKQRPELYRHVYPVFSQCIRPVSSETSNGIKRGTAYFPWSIGQLREALLSIGSRSTPTINCCLFVDALDENDGKFRELIALLMDLAQISNKNPSFRLRLCLAGRPENVFMDAFRTCPGFAIHNHTTADIRQYAEDNIRRLYPGDMNDQSEQASLLLVEEIVTKANGVFCG